MIGLVLTLLFCVLGYVEQGESHLAPVILTPYFQSTKLILDVLLYRLQVRDGHAISVHGAGLLAAEPLGDALGAKHMPALSHLGVLQHTMADGTHHLSVHLHREH